ncbi:hypothetical protein [Paenibacillus sp.]|uniref:lipase family alpha/beta hydrolase n=1 Tax=Paenibacillus sp. TaxID=58172 RepID=UPI00282EC42E|nr:hypothetical protein [Paenibacillus sp.]MDR0269917.1 hypothetical protein [Paenibacillus sp.]
MAIFLIIPNNAFAGKLEPPSEKFTPGDWFLGSTPPNLDPNKPPIVFVQGKNGTSAGWYGETTYHGTNDMYTKAYEAGYQTVFVQLYDAAGKGSASQYANGELLASILAQISNHFGGKKVNIVAHSKGGPDTQAALIHYGAHAYVGRVITLGSPHHGSHLADLSYSWYASWLASLLGQKDDGTYSLQVGEMARFRSVTDSSENTRKNKYYTVAGTSKGPPFTALALGGLYLSSHGPNDGLVNEWSTQLPYATHLFTDSTIDHDNIRMGSAVFSRIEPYLRTASTEGATTTINQSMNLDETLKSSELIHGGTLDPNDWVEESFNVDEATKGNIVLYTATDDGEAELISPTGQVYTASFLTPSDQGETSLFPSASIQAFELEKMEPGKWTVKMKTKAEKDAYLLISQFDDTEPIELDMPEKAKQEDTNFKIKASKQNKMQESNITLEIHVMDEKGNLVAQSTSKEKLKSASLSGELPDVPKSGVYNVSIDVTGERSDGTTFQRSLVQSIYIEKSEN